MKNLLSMVTATAMSMKSLFGTTSKPTVSVTEQRYASSQALQKQFTGDIITSGKHAGKHTHYLKAGEYVAR